MTSTRRQGSLAALWVLLQYTRGVVAPLDDYTYGLDRSDVPLPSMFRVRVQRAIADDSTEHLSGIFVSLTNAYSKNLTPNQALAAYFKRQVLDGQFMDDFRHYSTESITFAVFVANARVFAGFRPGEEMWVNAGASGEVFSSGLAQWPAAGHACSGTYRSRGTAIDFPFGRPCPEGGAIALKNEVWPGTVFDPKNIMVFYIPGLQLQRMSQISFRVINNELRNQVRSCIAKPQYEIPVDLTPMATCIRVQHGSDRVIGAIVVGVESVGLNFQLQDRDELYYSDINLSGYDAEGGFMSIASHVITVSKRNQPIGQMKLSIVMLPIISEQRFRMLISQNAPRPPG